MANRAMFTPKLQWIDEKDPESVKQSRVHRQKEFHRARRWKQVQEWQSQKEDAQQPAIVAEQKSEPTPSSGKPDDDKSPDDGRSQVVTEKSPDSPFIKEEAREDDGGSGSIIINDHAGTDPAASSKGKNQLVSSRVKREKDMQEEEEENPEIDHEDSMETRPREAGTSRILDQLTTSKRDPFAVLPFADAPDAWASQLVSHFLLDIPRMVYNVKDSPTNREVLFPMSLIGPAAFQATLLVQASCHIAQLQGVTDSIDSIQQKSKAIRLIQQRLDDPNPSVRTGDEVIAAVLSMADAENLFGFKDKATLHMRGVTAVIRERGGYRSIDSDRRLGIHMNWVNICLMRPTNFAELSSWSIYTIKSKDPMLTPKLDLADFLTFLVHAFNLSGSPQSKAQTAWRRELFGHGSTIQRMCAIPHHFSSWTGDLIPIYTRLAGLMHIHCALWEYRNSPLAYDQYLETLERIIVDYDFATSLSIAFFCYNMMKLDYDEAEKRNTQAGSTHGRDDDDDDDDLIHHRYHHHHDEHAVEPVKHPEKRSWYIGRILRVCKLLDQESMIQVHHVLLRSLDPDVSTKTLDLPPLDTWIEGLKDQIMASG